MLLQTVCSVTNSVAHMFDISSRNKDMTIQMEVEARSKTITDDLIT